MFKAWSRLAAVSALSVFLVGCAAQLPVLPSGSFALPSGSFALPSLDRSPAATDEQTAEPTEEPTEEPTAGTTPEPEPTDEPSGEPTAQPSGDATSEPTSGPSAEPTAVVTPAPGAWTGPERAALLPYSDVDMVVTPDGVVHAAAAFQDRVWHLTNAGGGWEAAAISDPPGAQSDASPSITIDSQGNLSVAFERRSEPDTFGQLPMGIYLTTGGPDSWSEPEQLDPAVIREPSLAVKPTNDRLNLVAGESVPVDLVEDGQSFPIHFLAGLPEDPSAERIANIGTDPALAIGPDGFARILLGDNIGTLDERALRFMTATSGPGDFEVANINGTSNYDSAYDLVIDSNNLAHAVWTAEDSGLYYSQGSGDSWTLPLLLEEDLVSDEAGIGIDAAGSIHIVTASFSSGAWYFTDRSGSFTAQQLHDDTTIHADVAIDGSGRAHVLFVTADPDDFLPQELWYAASPGI